MCCLREKNAFGLVSVFSPGGVLERWGRGECGSKQTRVPQYKVCTCGIWTLEFIAKTEKALFWPTQCCGAGCVQIQSQFLCGKL